MDNIERKALRDLFGSHQTEAAEEAQKRYTTKYHPDCCLLLSSHEFILRLQQAFIEGVIWKEEQSND